LVDINCGQLRCDNAGRRTRTTLVLREEDDERSCQRSAALSGGVAAPPRHFHGCGVGSLSAARRTLPATWAPRCSRAFLSPQARRTWKEGSRVGSWRSGWIDSIVLVRVCNSYNGRVVVRLCFYCRFHLLPSSTVKFCRVTSQSDSGVAARYLSTAPSAFRNAIPLPCHQHAADGCRRAWRVASPTTGLFAVRLSLLRNGTSRVCSLHTASC